MSKIAREFGLVTPYTAFLIMQDEQHRQVAASNQVMRDFATDKEAQARAGTAMTDLATPERRSGGQHVPRPK